MPAGCWRDLTDFTSDTLVLVLASEEYEESDYIRDFDAFLAWKTDNSPKTRVPYNDLKRYIDDPADGALSALQTVAKSGWYIGGSEVGRFEQAFAAYCGTAESVGVGNGLDALILILRAFDIGSGDEVIVPAHTFIATALAVSQVGAKPVLVDVDEATGLLDPTLVEAHVTSRTKALIAVHLYGHPCEMDALRHVASRHGLRLIEDAAQAHGARYRGRRCGDLGDAAAFSFYPTKNLGALGDAGAVVSNDPAICRRVRSLSNYGRDAGGAHREIGANTRLDPIQAAVLNDRLPRLDGWNAHRRELAAIYVAALGSHPGISLLTPPDWVEPVWHVFPVRAHQLDRAEFRQALQAAGVGTNVHYELPVHLQPAYHGAWRLGSFPVAEAICQKTVSLPLDAKHTVAEIERCAVAVLNVINTTH